MISQTSDGWFIEHNSRFYHVNQTWLDEMFRHQVKPYGNNPAYNRLAHAFKTGADAETVLERFKDFIDNRQRPAKPSRTEPTEFQQFIKERRASNRR